MRTSALCFALLAPALTASVDVAMAGDTGASRLKLSISEAQGSTSSASIVVQGSAGRYDRVVSSELRLPLTLQAELSASGDGFKIVKSQIALKAEGANASSQGADALGGAIPAASISATDSYALGFAPQSGVAQNAIAVCNTLSAADRSAKSAVTRTMAVAVNWRVTTGRFSFKWTNYDRVAPSHEIINNPDFYSDQVTEDAEVLVDATVHCEPLGNAAIAVQHAPPAKVRQASLTPEVPVAAKPVAEKPVQTARHDDNGKPQCDGGMVRQISTGSQDYLCLCPGNTVRTAIGDNAFACERRTRR